MALTDIAEDGKTSIDPERYDPENQMTCAECGSGLQGAGDRSTVGAYCKTCEEQVWVA